MAWRFMVANGYLIDQFLQDTANHRTDRYGGSVENRSRFAVEVVQAVVDAVGAERTGIRLSPWSDFQGMKMADLVPQLTDIIRKLKGFGLAYLHLVRSRVSGSSDAADEEPVDDSLDFALNIWDRPVLIAGGLEPKDAAYLVDKRTRTRTLLPCWAVLHRHAGLCRSASGTARAEQVQPRHLLPRQVARRVH